MRIYKCIVVGLIGLILTGCGPREDRIKQTSSGRPTAIFKNTTLDEAKAMLAEICANDGRATMSVSYNTVKCTKSIGDDFGATLYRAMFTERYASKPEIHLELSVYAAGKNVRVHANQWMEHQNAFGKTTKRPLNSNESFNSIQLKLDKLSATTDMKESTDTKSNTKSARLGGKSRYDVQQMLYKGGCSRDYPIDLVSSKAPVEIYSSDCNGKNAVVVRCEWGVCNIMK